MAAVPNYSLPTAVVSVRAVCKSGLAITNDRQRLFSAAGIRLIIKKPITTQTNTPVWFPTNGNRTTALEPPR